MSDDLIRPGIPYDGRVKEELRKSYPRGTISVTRGKEGTLEEDAPYLVRGGEHAVVMPRMQYSESVMAAISSGL